MTTSVPVVTVTVRPPVNAVGLTVMFAVAEVGLVTVMEFTAIPAPKPTVVVPEANVALTPGSATSSVRPVRRMPVHTRGGGRQPVWTSSRIRTRCSMNRWPSTRTRLTACE